MSLLPPILEGRISNFHQIWEGFLALLRNIRNSSPNIPSITSGESCMNFLPPDVNLSCSGVSAFYKKGCGCNKKEEAKSKFPANFWL